MATINSPIGVVVVEPQHYINVDDIKNFWIDPQYVKDRLGTNITGEEDLDCFLMELCRHFPGGTIYLRFNDRHRYITELSIECNKKILHYPYWKIPSNSPISKYFPEVVATVNLGGIENRQQFNLDRNICYRSLPF